MINENRKRKSTVEDDSFKQKKIVILNKNNKVIFLKRDKKINLHNLDNSGSDSSSSDSESSESESEPENNVVKEHVIIKDEIKNLDDLIKIGELYDENKTYNIDVKKFNSILKPLKKLRELIGMDTVKKTIVGHILYYTQNLEEENKDMLHTVIEGPPGVGKTEIGKILGEIYVNLGIIKPSKEEEEKQQINTNKKKGRPKKNNFGPLLGDIFSDSIFSAGNKKKNSFKNEDGLIFRIVKRSDLVGKYLGHTAVKTQEVIDSVQGGVLFIDEAYSLGNSEQRDSFSKEAIDTLNQNLSEKKSNFLCIIAGYKESLDTCFFKYNEGLKRRFPFKYEINSYDANELREIFKLKVRNLGWSVNDDELPISFFEKNLSKFENFGGDVETLFFKCKIEHGKRVYLLNESEKKKIKYIDIENGFNEFVKNKKDILDENIKATSMYTNLINKK